METHSFHKVLGKSNAFRQNLPTRKLREIVIIYSVKVLPDLQFQLIL